MMDTGTGEPLNLTEEERAALTRLVRRAIDEDRYPMAPRLDPLKAILAKLEPSKLAAPLPPPLPAGAGPSSGRYRRSGRDGDWEIDV
jgi:hypothetical protein